MTIREKLDAHNPRSAWNKGVKAYAGEILEYLEDNDLEVTEQNMLNGARDWREYSEGGCALYTDYAIAERLCNSSELRKVKGGERRPNNWETWLDTQARALHQAAALLLELK